MNTTEEKKVLIGNSFPFSLIRCNRLIVEQKPISELKDAVSVTEVASFWGHENTRTAAESVLGISLATHGERPAVTLSVCRASSPRRRGVCELLAAITGLSRGFPSADRHRGRPGADQGLACS